MPRNSVGVYSTPAGQPAIGGTVISSSTHNSLVGDLAQEISSSLDRNGRGPMLAPLRVPNGSAVLPTVSFANDTDTGLYLAADAEPAMAVAGTKRQEWTAAGSAVTGTFSVSGVASFPGTVFPRSNLPAVGQQVSASCGAFTTGSASPVDVTNLSVSLTTNGRPVVLMLAHDGSASPGRIIQGSAGANVGIQILRGASVAAYWTVGAGSAGTQFAASLFHLDVPAAGTYTYKVQAFSGAGTATIGNAVLIAFEL